MSYCLFEGLRSGDLRSPKSESKPPGRLEELAFLVGGTWVTSSGGTVWEESFAWGAGEQSLETVTVQKVNGSLAATGHGRFVWDSTNERIMSASMIEGTYYAAREVRPFRRGRWSFICEAVGTAGSENRVVMVHVDENTFEMVCKGGPARVYCREPAPSKQSPGAPPTPPPVR